MAGPTAVGKTAVAIALAQQLGTSIVSADSRQCYHEMNIGTARPAPTELAAVKHYFIDEFPVSKELTAADFEMIALGYIEEIFRVHDTAVVCGGTGLYIKALCDGLDEMPQTNDEIVGKIEEEYSKYGLEWLQKAVQQEDPLFYNEGEIQNPARLLRALSFVRSTGESITQYRTGKKKVRPFEIVKVGLELPREVLYGQINKRVDGMMRAGLLEEARQLFHLRHLKNLQTVGYSELFEYLEGKCTLAAAVDKIKQHTRNYAKRQMTWFRKDEGINWLQADDADLVEKILRQ